MTFALLVTLKLAVVLLIFAIGLGATLQDLTYLWRRPGLMARSLLAMYVIVPAIAFAMVKASTSRRPCGGLLVLAVSAGAPLLPRKLSSFGDDAFVFSLTVTSSLLAVVLVPTWVAVARPALSRLDRTVARRRRDGDREVVPAAAGGRHGGSRGLAEGARRCHR